MDRVTFPYHRTRLAVDKLIMWTLGKHSITSEPLQVIVGYAETGLVTRYALNCPGVEKSSSVYFSLSIAAVVMLAFVS